MPTGIYKHKPLSEETKRKMSIVRKGHVVTTEARKKIGIAQKGKIISTETKEKLKKTFFKKGRIPWNKGLKGFMAGTNSPSWKGGISGWQHKIRTSTEYKLWRKSVFERDNYTCIWCRQKGGEIHADHIKPFAYFPELRFAIDNGRTLCKDCHKKTDTFSRKYN